MLQFMWSLQFQSVKVHVLHGDEHSHRHSEVDLEQELEAYFSIYKHKTGRSNWEWHGLLKSQCLSLVMHLLQHHNTPILPILFLKLGTKISNM